MAGWRLNSGQPGDQLQTGSRVTDKLVAGKGRPAAGRGVVGMAPGMGVARLALGMLALDRALVGQGQARQAGQRGVGRAAAPVAGMEVGGREADKPVVAQVVWG